MEQEQALQGEMEYVRMGFSIRDRYGRVDKTRTDFVRAEIRRRDELARLIKQWEAYEARWRAILSSDGPLAFVDIPWPAFNPPSSVTELHPETVVRFFLESLQLPGNNVSEADRLRAALLRWHPDKMSGIFARVMDSDVQNVREGVNLVFRALHGRLHHVKDNAGTKP
ncbi:hypothetical protein BD413DRAFT_602066 [Trametes elegans]|nr:hypothetical protein BD413DRAFT_602066 [Trametes elegans]